MLSTHVTDILGPTFIALGEIVSAIRMLCSNVVQPGAVKHAHEHLVVRVGVDILKVALVFSFSILVTLHCKGADRDRLGGGCGRLGRQCRLVLLSFLRKFTMSVRYRTFHSE